MAQCPGCERNWLWDWEDDTYSLADGTKPLTLALQERIIYTCPCGTRLGCLNTDLPLEGPWDEGPASITEEPEEWADVDWDEDGYPFYEDNPNDLEDYDG